MENSISVQTQCVKQKTWNTSNKDITFTHTGLKQCHRHCFCPATGLSVICVHSLDCSFIMDLSVWHITLIKGKFVLKNEQKSHKQNWKNIYYFGICTSATFFSYNANYIVHLTEGTTLGVPTITQNTIHHHIRVTEHTGPTQNNPARSLCTLRLV
jgi:hypothetical protein